jgi:beta-glucanase (GH16 family)
VYSIEWSPDNIKWFLNGVQYYQANIGPSSTSKEEFHETFYLILNLAVGGNWPGSPDGTTEFPGIMLVDYVRVYQNEDNLSVPETKVNDLVVYPNPAQESITIEGIDTIASYSVFNMLGQEILVGDTETLNVSMLNAGMYYIKAELLDGTLVSTPLEIQ